jgi:hypothetical protein
VVGAGLIYGVGPAVVSAGSDIPPLMLGQAIASTVLAALTALVFRGRPPVPPTPSAATVAASETQHTGFLSHVKAVFMDRNFVVLFWTFGLGFGVFTGFSGLINQIVLPLGYTNVREEGGGDRRRWWSSELCAGRGRILWHCADRFWRGGLCAYRYAQLSLPQCELG